MEKIKIDLSVAAILEMGNIAEDEVRDIDFDAEEDWPGTYELKVYNSRAKNDERVIADAITTTEKRLTWHLSPSEQQLTPGKHYCEITHVEENTIIIKSELSIEK